MVVDWGLNKFDNAPLTTGIYPASGFDLENQSEWAIYDYNTWGYTPDVGFVTYPDSVIICVGEIQNQNYPYNNIDSFMTITNGKFHLRKY